MASNLYRTRAVLQIPRCVPTLIARAQSAQSTPTAGKGIPPPGNFNSAIPPPPKVNAAGANKATPPFGGPAANPSFLETPVGKFGAVAAVSIALYTGYKMMGGNKDDSKDKKDQKGQKDGKEKADQQGGKDQKDSKGSGAQQGQGDQKGQKDQKQPKGDDDQKGQKESKGDDQNKKGGADKQADNAKDKAGKK